MNTHIIQEFDNLIQNLYSEKPPNYTFKVKSFKTAITVIRDLDFKIKNSSGLKEKKIKGIGKGILDRIDEIINSGNLKENKTENKSVTNELRLLQNITGIGPKKAQTLVDNNITLSVLLNKPSEEILSNLTHHQKIGLKYYYDLQKKIPNSIIKKFEKILHTFGFSFTICGSYRREKEYSSDMDILVLHNKYTLSQLITLLKKNNILVDDLTNKGQTKYMGICQTPGFDQFMRIDIRLVTKEQYPFTILYFTGSKDTNTYMRQKAIDMNYKLNEYGLYDKNNTPILLKTEEEIFNILQCPYKIPSAR